MFIKFFSFTRSEQKGIIVLLLLLLFLIVIRLVLPYYLLQDHKSHISDYEEYFSNLNDSLIQSRVKKDTVFSFSLASVSSKEMDQLGFNRFQKSNVVAYRNAGGKFYSIADFNKIYGVDSILVSKLEDYIIFDKSRSVTRNHLKKKDLNKAEVGDLLKIKGLGSLYAKRIVKFRNALGGFYSIEQLDEVYGLKADVRKEVCASFFVLPNSFKKIDLGSITKSELSRHAYLSSKQAAQLLRVYADCKDQSDTLLFYNQLRQNDLDRIIPYLFNFQTSEN